MDSHRRTVALRFALFATLLTPALHLLVLVASNLDPVSSPISALSSQDWGALHSLALILFGGAHVALALALGGLDHGKLWPVARGLLLAAGATLLYITWYFATALDSTLYGPDANDPLWVVASLIGMAMGALQPGLSRLAGGLGLFSTVCLGVWLWLIPLILLVNEHWLGAYERLVGSIYVIWMTGVTLGLVVVVRARAQ